jgi:hypothetical protein
MPYMLRVKFLEDRGEFKKGDVAFYPEPLVKLAPDKFEVDPVEPEEKPKPKAKEK